MKNLKSEIKRNNPWYVDSHIELYSRKPYRRVIAARLKFIEDEVYRIAHAADQCVKLLEAGCGDGFYLGKLKGISNTTFFGLDYNILRVRRVKKENEGASLINANLKVIPFKDNIFDIVLVNHVLEHIEDDQGILKEIYRVLRPGGTMILGVPNEGCLIARIRNNILQRSILRDTDHVHFYTESKLKDKLALVNFRIVKVRREGFFCPVVQLNEILGSYELAFKFLYFLGRIFKSQSAGMHFICQKDIVN